MACKMHNVTVVRPDIDACVSGASKLQVEILAQCRTRREKALTEATKSLAASIVIDNRFAGRLTFLSLERSLPLAIPEAKARTLRDHQAAFPTLFTHREVAVLWSTCRRFRSSVG